MANRAGKGVKSLFTIKLLYNVNDYASFLVHVCCASLSCGGIEKQGKSGYGFLCKHSFPCGQRKIQYLFCQHMTRRSKLYIVCSDFFQKVRAHSFRCSSFSSRKRSAGLRLDEMGLWIGASFSSTQCMLNRLFR